MGNGAERASWSRQSADPVDPLPLGSHGARPAFLFGTVRNQPLVGGRCISRGRLILVLADRVDLRVPVASSAALRWLGARFGQMSWRAYCGDYQRTLLLTSGW